MLSFRRTTLGKTLFSSNCSVCLSGSDLSFSSFALCLLFTQNTLDFVLLFYLRLILLYFIFDTHWIQELVA